MQYIYEVVIQSIPVKGLDWKMNPDITYFSNLKKTIEMLQVALVTQGWPVTVSYSSAYRGLVNGGFYKKVFEVEGVKYFRITITRKILNPRLTTLGIDKMPTLKK
jgi:hypothetical protein